MYSQTTFPFLLKMTFIFHLFLKKYLIKHPPNHRLVAPNTIADELHQVIMFDPFVIVFRFNIRDFFVTRWASAIRDAFTFEADSAHKALADSNIEIFRREHLFHLL